MAIGTTLKISFDSKKVQTGLDQMKSDFRQLGGMMKTMTKIGAGIAVGILAATAAIGASVLKINAIGEEARAGDERLRNITKQMGLFGDSAGDVSQRLLDLADAEERMTGTDTIIATQAKLMTFKELAKSADKAGGAFDRATMAAVDMAAAGFGEATSNATQLGKALNDPIKGINSLTRAGITFTAEEKEKIAVMVRGGQTMKAQYMILRIIEKQVGGTARATATASGKIKQSFSQIVEAFAIPFSEGFNSLPGALEGVFSDIISTAKQLGQDFGTAIAEAVNGDYDRLFAIGEFIGSAIGGGLKISMQSAWVEAGQAIGGGLMRPFQSDEERLNTIRQNRADAEGYKQSLRDDLVGNLSSLYQSRIKTDSPVFTPTTTPQSFTAAPVSSRDPFAETMADQLKQIERNTREGFKF